MISSSTRIFSIYMVLVAIHSFCVGLGLILIPLEFYGIFGFESYQGSFFKIQAGVFHFVVCGAYIPAARKPLQSRDLIKFAAFAKFTATLFLFSYTIIVERIWMVWASGIFDLLMGVIIIWFYRGLFPAVESNEVSDGSA